MPELPEVEIARRALTAWSAGRRIAGVRAPDPASVRTHLSTRPSDALPGGTGILARRITGARPEPVRRHGKRLAWPFSAPDAGLLAHLGMSGKWVRRDRDEPPRHGRLALDLDDGAALWFVDPRRFGGVTLADPDDLEAALSAGLGPDALRDAPDGPTLASRFTGRRAIKVALLDQALLAGVGNIQAAESLWRARIHPATRVDALDADAWDRLARAIPAQLRRAIDQESGPEITYLQEAGAHNPFVVYGREDVPCPRCDTPIARTTQSGRATFWCPGCQPRPSRDSRAGRSSR